MSNKPVYFTTQDKGEVVYKEWLAEDRKEDQGYDLVIFAHLKKEFLKEKLAGHKSLDDYNDPKEFVLELAKEKEAGKYFHNTKGPAYGAAHRKTDGTLEIVHPEYWISGKRLTDEAEIKKVIHDSQFSEKANNFINS